MSQVKTITGPAVPLVLDDIDTDRIIPARFLRCVVFDGLGEHAFEDDREQDPNHPFNKEQFQNAKILVGGRNFGCGSSREHAPQSLMRWGLDAIVAESFAEIFFGNCTGLGIPCVSASRQNLETLGAAVEADPNLEVIVDLESMTVTYGDNSFDIEMPKAAREALVTGKYDFLAELLANKPIIEKTAETLPYMSGYQA